MELKQHSLILRGGADGVETAVASSHVAGQVELKPM